MSTTGMDDGIRADFLTEAGELMETLGSQLVELERRPNDRELLNAVFRAFHTVKGGAGFLQLSPVVGLCHAAEDVFGLIRAGHRHLDPALMDATMQSLDQLQRMLAQVSEGHDPDPAPAELIHALRRGDKLVAENPGTVVATPAAVAAPAGGAITDDEFERLLDELHGSAPPGCSTPVAEPVAIRPVENVPSPSTLGTPTMDARPREGIATAVAPAEMTVRVDTQRLDQLMNLVGELVLVRNRLKTLRASGAPAGSYANCVGELDHLTRSLQAAVMHIRMQPIRKVFSRFPKLARDVARGLGKQVEVELIGEETDLDKNLVEALADPLVHMVRNSVDHGIERPEIRAACGKPLAGKLTLSAQSEGDHILISVRDDGAGIDPENLRRKAIDKGLVDANVAARMGRDECLQLVFLPGFSTKEEVSDLSGRGVGMDVVKSRITALNGNVLIESSVGQGSCVKLRVPLTLAILPALMVAVGNRLLALPLADVFEVFALDEKSLRRLDHWQAVLHRRDTLRLIDLERWIGAESPPLDVPRHVVVAQVDGERFGFIVHQVRAREEVVIKPLGAGLRGLTGLAGATVTGEGRVALILDFPGLVRAWGSSRQG